MGGCVNPKTYLLLAAFSLTIVSSAMSRTIYVDANAPGSNDGSSWENAYNFLQDALADANSAVKPVEIRVAQGTYRPDENTLHPDGTGDRTATFQLINGVTIKGGYAGLDYPDPNARDIDLFETVLSGDLNGDDIDVNDLADLMNEQTRAENNYHVVIARDTDTNAVLDGFTVTAGNSNGFYFEEKCGGGMVNERSSPALNNCIFTRNSAISSGGGIYNRDNSKPTVSNCTFSENTANSGGGMCNSHGSAPTLTNCSLRGNIACGGWGGAMVNGNSSPTLTNCTFIGNSAKRGLGGGMYTAGGNPALTNCTFSGNSARAGGGIVADFTTLTNCTFSHNIAQRGGALFNTPGGNVNAANCIMWGDRAMLGNEIYLSSLGYYMVPLPTATTVSFSNIQWSYAGAYIEKGSTLNWSEANIEADPLFVEADGPDNIAGTEDDNLRLLSLSPCIDVGNNDNSPPLPSTDADGNPRIVNGIVDMGAYEGPKQGFLLSTKSPVVPEGGTATFTLALSIDPMDITEVTVVYHSGDPDITVVSGGLMTFDSSNYFIPQSVTLAAVEDGDHLNGKAVIFVSAPGFVTAGVTANEADNEPYPNILLVDTDAPGTNNGANWTDAFTDLQQALSVARITPEIDQIWVGQGVYRPTGPAGDRTATFHLVNGVAVKGGYAGFGESNPDARDIELYETILSGDLNGDDGPNFINNGENSFHVITSTDTDETAIIDGFTITGGNANGASLFSRFGGGMLAETDCHWSNPTVTNCKFIENSAVWGGGLGDGDGLIYKCIIRGNKAESSGGGVCSWRGPIRNCIIEKNRSGRGGGGIGEGYGCDIFSCIIRENSAEWTGGGIRNPTGYICNCIISNNSARWGGGIYNDGDTTVLTNCTFTDNQGSGIYAGSDDDSAIVVMTNCIFWNDNYDEDYGSTFIMNYNCFQDLPDDLDGIGNIVADPCFVSIGYWDSNGVWVNGDYHLLRGSPCIDAGDPDYIVKPDETDLDGRPRVIGGRIDMGAYEYSPPISAGVRIVPHTINLQSKGKWINAFLWLPEDYNVTDIDDGSVLLENEIEPQWVWFDEEEQVGMVMFSRQEVQDILTIGEVGLTITGRLTDGKIFEAKDVIIVINKGGRKSAL